MQRGSRHGNPRHRPDERCIEHLRRDGSRRQLFVGMEPQYEGPQSRRVRCEGLHRNRYRNVHVRLEVNRRKRGRTPNGRRPWIPVPPTGGCKSHSGRTSCGPHSGQIFRRWWRVVVEVRAVGIRLETWPLRPSDHALVKFTGKPEKKSEGALVSRPTCGPTQRMLNVLLLDRLVESQKRFQLKAWTVRAPL